MSTASRILPGTLIGDITPADVYQRHSEPPSWTWPAQGPAVDFEWMAPTTKSGRAIALKVALSATVDDGRIRAVLGEDAAIWSLTTPPPPSDALKRRTDRRFREKSHGLIDRIKAEHGADRPLYVSPAMPVATAHITSPRSGRWWPQPVIFHKSDGWTAGLGRGSTPLRRQHEQMAEIGESKAGREWRIVGRLAVNGRGPGACAAPHK